MDECKHCVTRRGFLATGAAVGLAGQFGFIESLLAQDGAARRAKACILLWMSGGPSQIDTWDPKPGTETGGEFKAIDTAVKGIRISETLPLLAKEMKRFSIVRGLESPEGDHGRGAYLMHTGYRLLEASPYPAAGSMFSQELGQDLPFPKYVTIGDTGYGPAFLAQKHAPFAVGDPATALAQIQQIAQQGGRFELMEKLQERHEKTHPGDAQARREEAIRGIVKLAETPFAKALDMSQESEETRLEYGEGAFGQGCLLARRLVEVGVKFVEVTLGGWDTHSDNFNGVRALCGELDPAMSTLLRDLDRRGLLQETIVLWMGEFGRTPAINATNGRDHFPQVTPVAIAGGPIQGGRAIGATDRTGREIATTPLKVADLFGTLYQACGIDTQKKYFNREGKLFKPTDGGMPIKDLLS